MVMTLGGGGRAFTCVHRSFTSRFSESSPGPHCLPRHCPAARSPLSCGARPHSLPQVARLRFPRPGRAVRRVRARLLCPERRVFREKARPSGRVPRPSGGPAARGAPGGRPTRPDGLDQLDRLAIVAGHARHRRAHPLLDDVVAVALDSAAQPDDVGELVGGEHGYRAWAAISATSPPAPSSPSTC